MKLTHSEKRALVLQSRQKIEFPVKVDKYSKKIERRIIKLKPRGLARMRKVWNENPDAFEKELERIPSTVSMSESSRKRYFKIFPNAERRYLDYIKKESNK